MSDVFRHMIALVRLLTGCDEFAAWAPHEVQPSGDPASDFLCGQMWPHLLTAWPPLAPRETRFLSTQNARISTTSGMSNHRRWVGASLLRPHYGDGDAANNVT